MSDDENGVRLGPGKGQRETDAVGRGDAAEVIGSADDPIGQLTLPLGPALPSVEGAGLARAALQVVDAGADEWWVSGVERAIAVLAETRRPFCVDDVRSMVGEHCGSPNAWGPRFALARARGVIEPVDAIPSRRASRHAALVRRWRGVAS